MAGLLQIKKKVFKVALKSFVMAVRYLNYSRGSNASPWAQAKCVKSFDPKFQYSTIH